jgi:CelD/BcsL family acetyltransferase involved in cellulose biosynthesis
MAISVQGGARQRDRGGEAVSATLEGALRIETVRSLEGLAEHAAAWDGLLREVPHPAPQLSYAWVATLLEHEVGPGESWWCCFAYEGERLVGVLPVVARPHRLLGRRWPRLRAPENGHTRIGEPLLLSGRERETLGALLAALRREVSGVLAIEFFGVRENSPTRRALDAGLPGVVAVRAADERGSLVRTTSEIEEFRARLGTNFAGNLRKARNKLAKLPGASMEVVADPALVDAAFERFVAVEAAGWKGERGSAIGCATGRTAFFRALAQRLAASGTLEWHFLTAEGRTIAGHFAARIGGSLALIKIGYDEGYARCAPGNLLFERTVERAFADEATAEVNCLTDMAWHRNWRMEQAAYERIWLFPRRPLALLCAYLPTQCWLLARRLAIPLRDRLRAWRRGAKA